MNQYIKAPKECFPRKHFIFREYNDFDLCVYKLPWWEAIAYRKQGMTISVACPWGLHLVIGWVHSTYWRLRIRRVGQLPEIIRNVEKKAFWEGRKSYHRNLSRRCAELDDFHMRQIFYGIIDSERDHYG